MLSHIIRKFAYAIIENHDWESMEAVLYMDGDYGFRQRGSTGPAEDEIVATLPLGQAYWGESYFWGEDLEENEGLRELAIDDVVEDICYAIDEWKYEQN